MKEKLFILLILVAIYFVSCQGSGHKSQSWHPNNHTGKGNKTYHPQKH